MEKLFYFKLLVKYHYSHVDRYSKHGLLEDSITLNTPLATRQQQPQQSLSSALVFFIMINLIIIKTRFLFFLNIDIGMVK